MGISGWILGLSIEWGGIKRGAGPRREVDRHRVAAGLAGSLWGERLKGSSDLTKPGL